MKFFPTFTRSLTATLAGIMLVPTSVTFLSSDSLAGGVAVRGPRGGGAAAGRTPRSGGAAVKTPRGGGAAAVSTPRGGGATVRTPSGGGAAVRTSGPVAATPNRGPASVHGTARRTARRTTRRINTLPRGYTTTVVSGVTYYYVDGIYYEAVYEGSTVVYIQVVFD